VSEKEGILMLPSTPKVFKKTKRELFARRMVQMDKPLVVVSFQGVIGDFMFEKGDVDVVNIRAGALEGLKLLSYHFQLVIFSRESPEDSWSNTTGGQIPGFNDQNKQIKLFLKGHPEIKIDGYYTSLVPVKQQTIWEDYS